MESTIYSYCKSIALKDYMQFSNIGLKTTDKDFATSKARNTNGIKEYLHNHLDELKTFELFIDDTLNVESTFYFLDKSLPGLQKEKGRDKLIIDIIYLARLFLKQVKSKRIQIQLEVVTTNMCRIFHADNIRQRLLCTYLAPVRNG